MEIDRKGRRLLARAHIGMLAIHGERQPLVNPVAYQFAAGSVWMTTSRSAVKVGLARKDPRGSFLVVGRTQSLLLHGTLEIYDPLTLSGQIRAALDGPRFYSSLARYGFKNMNFIGGYLLDLAHIPPQWWPQNRLVIRLRVDGVRAEPPPDWPKGESVEVPDVPQNLRRSLGSVSTGYLCWGSRGVLMLEACMWAVGRDGALVSALGADGLRGPSAPQQGALVVEKHHPYRATRMMGACLRGRLQRDPSGARDLRRRYDVDKDALGITLRLDTERVTWWRGFQVATAMVAASRASTA